MPRRLAAREPEGTTGGVAALLAIALAAACSSAERSDQSPTPSGPAYPATLAPLVLPPGEVGFVSSAYSDTIDVFRMNPLGRIASYHVGRIPIDRDGASHLVLDKSGRSLYIALPYPQVSASTGPHAEHASSTRAGYVQKLGISDFRDLGSVRVDENPADLSLSDDGRRLVATHFDLSRATSKGLPADERKGALVMMDTARHFAGAGLSAPRLRVCRAPHGLVLSPGAGQFAFVACYVDDAIAKVNLDSSEVTLRPLAEVVNETDVPRIGPYAVALSGSATRLALGTTEGKDVRIVDTATMAPSGPPVPVGGAAYFPAWSADDARLFVPTQSPDAIVTVDPAKGSVTTQRTFTPAECLKPHAVRVSKDGTRLYVVCEGDRKQNGALLALDATTLQTVAREATGVYPDRIALTEGP